MHEVDLILLRTKKSLGNRLLMRVKNSSGTLCSRAETKEVSPSLVGPIPVSLVASAINIDVE